GTSLPLPDAPLAPTGLLASGISTSANEITWTDNATDETAYELYRSAGGNSNYVLLATLPAGTVTYKDSGLFANSISYYRVRAKNVSGPSGYSNEDSAKTLNTVPVFVTSLSNQHMRYGTQLQLNVTAVDPDPELLNIQVTGLPAFGSYTPSGNGTGTLSFNPASVTDQGTYNDITVTVNDEHGGSSSQVFNLTVNDNYNPHIDPISNVTVAELQTAQLNVSATDQNVADVLNWEFIGLPGFATVSTNGGTAQLNFAPGYADNGVYPVQAKVTDGNNGFDTLTFYITVNDVNPDKKIYVNFTNGTYTSPAPWNNTAKNPVQNDNFAALKDETGATSAVGIQILTPWQSMTSSGVNTLGVSTNNNSGIYPDNVMRTSYFTTTVTQTLRIYGLSPLYKYNFTVFGSRANPAAGVVVVADYVMNGQTLSLNAANNSQNTVTFSNLSPAPDGTLNLDVRAQAGSQFAYLGTLVISSVYDDGTAPAKPRNLAGQLVSGKVNLSWVDAAYNETGYEVYRSNSREGAYTLLNPGGSTANLVSFTDSTVLGGPTYYYAVRAVNGIGASPYSDTIAVGTINTAPVFTGEVSDIRVGINEAKNVAVTAADIPGDVITLSASGLPSFASFTDNGNGNGVIQVTGTGTVGTYGGITITATDNKGAAASRQIKIVVKNGVSTYVNFTNGTYTSPAPWNNTNSAPVANFTLSNLQDENGNGTGVSLTLPEAWTGSNTNGVVTGDNSGVYPDNVIRSFYYQSAPDVRTVRLSGLSSANKYNLVFFASRANYNLALTSSYTVGAQSVVLNATNNSSTTASINGVSPDANGQIIISIAAANGSQFSYLGALEIVSYPFDGTPSSPTNLVASGISKTQIKLDWTGTAENSGYQVWRSTSLNGSYSLLGTVGTNVTTYTNNGLSAGSSYYYKVRTITGANVYSAYSNVAAASTVAFQVNL
ncbi:fibronectin type III domain-containing protein, partial [Foetidibacter luteolus]|uniref:fibronectin type III domain-containing protein n=1 Tax=Foetidibacter luteolus TaxID=2608880 RepID=UPI00129A2131